ncbi:MAG: YihY/virulence factor BrkB family protein [bacterium]
MATSNGPAARKGIRVYARGVPGVMWLALVKFFADDCSAMAAAISFYTFFSLPALLTLLLTLLGKTMDPQTVQHAIVAEVGSLIGRAGAEQVTAILLHARRSDHASVVATILGLLALAFGSSAAFTQLQSALNTIWSVKPDPTRNQFHMFVMKRVWSFGIVLTVAFLSLVSLVTSAVIAAATTSVAERLGLSSVVLQVGSSVLAFVAIAALFALMFRYMPDARISWRDVRAGALGSAVLFILGKTLIGLYLGGTNPGSAYGAAGSLAVVLIWVYYTSMVLLLGAEFTELWAEKFGHGIVPEHGAIAYVVNEKTVAVK